MMFLLGFLTCFWICSLIALLLEVRAAPLIEDEIEIVGEIE